MNAAWLRYLPAPLRERLDGRASVQAMIGNTGWLLFDRAVRTVVGIAVGAWVARYLGPAQFGELAYALAFVAIFQILAQLGLDSLVVRDIGADPGNARERLGTALRLRLVAGLACWGAAIGGMALLRPGDTGALLLVAIVAGSIVFQAADTVDLWFQSQTQSKRTVAAKSLAFALASALKVALVLWQAPLAAFAAVVMVEAALSALALVLVYRRYPAPGRWTWSATRGGDLLREAWPLLVSGLAVVLYMRVDQIMLRELVGEGELGIYSAALSLSTLWYFIPMAIYSSTAPAFSRLKLQSEAAYLEALARLFALMWALAGAVSIVMALSAGFLVDLLYGGAYRDAATVLAVHVFANIPVALGVAQSLWITNERRPQFALYRTLFGLLVNVALNLALIPRYGAIGAALATLIAQFCAAVLFNAFAAREILALQFLWLTKWTTASRP
ncbi:MAG TPA: flippase [Burkholderiales bacterium]|nr:flippase [Burkholderiales bacterium]